MIPSDRRAELAHDAAARPAAESRGARLRSRLRVRDQLEHGLLRRRGDTGELGAIYTLVLGWRASSRICRFSSAVHVRLVFFASVLSPMQGPAPPRSGDKRHSVTSADSSLSAEPLQTD